MFEKVQEKNCALLRTKILPVDNWVSGHGGEKFMPKGAFTLDVRQPSEVVAYAHGSQPMGRNQKLGNLKFFFGRF